MADDAVKFPRTPYKVTYQDLHGVTKTIRRVPPPKLHEALPTDIVKLTSKRSDDFDVGDEVEVANISWKQPNTLQVKDGNGATTFVEFYDIELKEERAVRDGVDPRDRPQNNRYLLWP